MDAFHWAANRGQLDIVKLLTDRKANPETVNAYGGTVLRCAAWSAVFEPRPNHAAIIRALVEAGASVEAALDPTGDPRVDALLATDLR